jgi:hypothetical protein
MKLEKGTDMKCSALRTGKICGGGNQVPTFSKPLVD